MAGWVGEWMDGWKGGWVGLRVDGWMNGWIDRLADSHYLQSESIKIL